jgi:hypothetical protein
VNASLYDTICGYFSRFINRPQAYHHIYRTHRFHSTVNKQNNESKIITDKGIGNSETTTPWSVVVAVKVVRRVGTLSPPQLLQFPGTVGVRSFRRVEVDVDLDLGRVELVVDVVVAVTWITKAAGSAGTGTSGTS